MQRDGDKVFVTFQYPDYFPVMDYAKRETTRKKLFIAHENKCSENVPLFKEVVVLRDEAARLLEYVNFATFQLEDKMVQSPVIINTFLADLRTRLMAKGRNEIQHLKGLKEADVGDKHCLLSDYGAGYYSYLLSDVHALDMFSVFRSDPLNSERGRRYRHRVLEVGGRQQEMRTLMDFLGREPDTGAFYQELGVS